ncbi:MASE1 domain-containing protein [Rhodanobacter sp. Root480]|uniref:MASE1 domain-containing sensor histidine kinase n=1 Tax=Rhodanobacter sp. Root480 TaxID=1736542 RepID=UPI001F38DE6D|nr:MASE1 domain-containing protein [Rhodanobacter sp. Root480]
MYHRAMLSKSFLTSCLGPMLGLAYFLAWMALWPTAQPFWMLPYGLRFGALLLAPMRYWGWLLGAECVASFGIVMNQGAPAGWNGLLFGELPDMLVMAGGLWLVRRFGWQVTLNTPQQMARLLLIVLVLVAATAITDATALTALHRGSDQMLRILGEQLLSHYLAILLLVPLMVMLLQDRLDRGALISLLIDGVLVMLPSMAILLLLSRQAAPEPQFARVLSLAPILYFAFRHGWRGASLAMLVTSAGITLAEHRLGYAPSTASAYLLLAVAGTGAIMLGSATDALRESSAYVAEQNAYMGAVNYHLDQLTGQLRNAARGNLRADENQRRHLAAELHDELGQNITAIQTHVKLAEARLRQAGLEDISSSINTILGHMRRALHRLLDDLRPAVLDEFGLMRALDEGPIRDLLTTAGIAYHTDLYGDPRQLDEDIRTAIYRLAQESATNAVKHSGATEFRLRLRIGKRQGIALALLDLRDNGTGLPARVPRGGRGLQGMRDRVTSLGGDFRLHPQQPGVHLRILLRNSNGGADPSALA